MLGRQCQIYSRCMCVLVCKHLKTYQPVFIKHFKQQAMLSGINLKCDMERNEQIVGMYNPPDH